MVNHTTEKQFTIKSGDEAPDSRGWLITYRTRRILDDRIYLNDDAVRVYNPYWGDEQAVYFTLAEHFRQFVDLLGEAGYINCSKPVAHKV